MERSKKFTLVIPNERFRLARRFHISFLVLFSLALVYVSLMTHQWGGIFMAALALLSLFGLWRKTKVTANPFTGNVWEVGFIWLCMGWFNSENYWIMTMVFLVSILGISIRAAYEIRFSENEIFIRSFPGKKVKWFELNNVVLKDGLLTIDFKNDKLVQAEILQEESDVAHEDAFNGFCRQQLETHAFAPATEY